MKRIFLKSWIAAVLFAGACCVMTACNDDDNNGGQNPPVDPDTAVVIGDYAGTMNSVDAAPLEGGEEPAGTAVEASVTDAAVSFADLPVRDLIVRILGDLGLPSDDETVDGIIAGLGKIVYEIPYTATAAEDKSTVNMTLSPAELAFTLAVEGGETTADGSEEPAGMEIVVTVESDADAVFTVESKNLVFDLSVAGVKCAGAELEGFEPFTLHFDLTQK